jgi:centractin
MLYQDFGTRLLGELKKLSPKENKIKIMAPPERRYSTWMGCVLRNSLPDEETVLCDCGAVSVLYPSR